MLPCLIVLDSPEPFLFPLILTCDSPCPCGIVGRYQSTWKKEAEMRAGGGGVVVVGGRGRFGNPVSMYSE